MRSIDSKYQRMIDNREMKKEKEKQTWTKRLLEQLRKDQIALKTWKRTLTSHEKSKQDSTAYADACYWVQLLSKLRDTNNSWSCFCITCEASCSWDKLEWWHCIAKWSSKATALDYRNVNAQCSYCNAKFWGNGRYDVYQIKVDEKWWVGTHDDLLRIKKLRIQTKPEQRLKENIETIEMMLSSKIFDTSYYLNWCKKIRKKYCTDN